jgi:uncharacterized protein YfaS (alpha-2-macroglobulin family)
MTWTGVAVSLSDRTDLWGEYAALLLRHPTDNSRTQREFRQRAISAATNAYLRAESAGQRVNALQVMAEALDTNGRGRDSIAPLRLAFGIQPRPEIEIALDAAIGKYGFRITDSNVESDSATPRICAEFSEMLVARGVDYEPFVQLPEAGMVVQVEDDRLCIDGLSHGARYTITFREGLPSADGETMAKDVSLTHYVRDRSPAVRFPGRAYVLPKVADAALPVETVNVTTLDLRLRRVSDRNLMRTFLDEYFGRPLSSWQEENFADEIAQEVWTGTAEVSGDLNRDATTRLPLDTALSDQPAGIYALSARVPNTDPWDVSGATQWFVLSDLGLSTLSGTDGLHVSVRSLGDAAPRAGIAVELISRANAVLGRAVTDADGLARFDAGLTRGSGAAAPALVLARQGDEDLAFLSLTEPAFDLSDRGVEGRAAPGPVDVFLTTDRGAYRAGETIHATVLARDGRAEAIEGLPLIAILSRPDGVEYRRRVSGGGDAGGHVFALPVGETAPRGTWRLEIKSDPKAPALATQTLLVEDFLPERIDFDLALPAGALRIGQTVPLTIEARYLFGAPGSDLSIEGTVDLRGADTVDGWPGYRFGRHDARGWPRRDNFGRMRTDADGRAVLDLDLPEPDAEGQPLKATFVVRVSEGSARPVERRISAPVAPATPVIGIKPLFDEVVAEGTEAAFEVIALSPDLQPAAMPVRWTLNRVETRYQWYQLYGDWNWEPVTRRTRIATGQVALGAGPLPLTHPVEWGEYELVVEDANGGPIAASAKFYAGWYVAADATSTPDRLDMSLDKPRYAPGDTAMLRIVPRAAGTALVTVMSDRVIARVAVAVTEGETMIPLPVTADWGSGAYVSATVVRPMDVAAGRNPARAIGIAHAAVAPVGRELSVAIDVPEVAEPRQTQRARLTVTGAQPGEKVWLTLASVDLGILNLTGFQSPDPKAHYFGQKRLGMEMRDVYGRLIDGMNGALGTVRSGGDDGSGMRMQSPPPTQDLMARFSGPVQVGDNGEAFVNIELPAFNGTVRLMAVAWSKSGVGQGERDMLVRDPVVVTATVPRFLAPGDSSRILIEAVHADGPSGEMQLALEPKGSGLSLGNVPSRFQLTQGGKASFLVPVVANTVGDPGFDLVLTTPDGRVLRQSLRLPVRANDPVVATTRRFALGAGDTFRFSGDVFDGLRPGTAEAVISAGALAKFDAPGLLAALDRYPYGCTEQVTSKAMPLLYLSAVAQASGLGNGPDVVARVDDAIAQILTRQASNGAFGLWRAESGDFWLDAYVSDFLSRARAQGFVVPDLAFRQAMDNLRNKISYASDFDDGGEDIAYALMVLAREGAAAMGDLRYYVDVKADAFTAPLAAAQVGAALASYGDQMRADAMFARAARMLATDAGDDRPYWRADYGTRLRDQAGVLTLAAEAGSRVVDTDTLAAVVGRTDTHRSTQESAWTLLAAHALIKAPEASDLRIDGAPVDGPFVRMLSDDTPGQGVAITTEGGKPTEITLTTLGVPEVAPPAGGAGYTIQRRYFTMEGETLDIARLTVGDRFVAVLEVTPHEQLGARLIIDDPLPAGVEIDNPSLLRSGDVGALDWLETTDATHAEFRSDRFIAAVETTSDDKSILLAYVARAVSPGEFHHPAASVEDMYRPTRRARTDTGRLTVSP